MLYFPSRPFLSSSWKAVPNSSQTSIYLVERNVKLTRSCSSFFSIHKSCKVGLVRTQICAKQYLESLSVVFSVLPKCADSSTRNEEWFGWNNGDAKCSKRCLFYVLITILPYCIGLVDGTKVERWRPKDTADQQRKWDGHHHFNCSSALFWVNIFGCIIPIDFRNDRIHQHRSMFNYSEIIRSISIYFQFD